MKKFLIATTALVATAGVAAAEVSLSGTARMGLQYEDAATNVEDFKLHTRVRARISATGETDGGLGWGVTTRVQVTNGSTANTVNSTSIWLSGTWGELRVGDTDAAGDDFGITSWGFANVGGGEAGEKARYTGDANVRYTGSFGDLTVVATTLLGYDYGTLPSTPTNPANGDWSLGLGYDFGMFAVNLAYDHDDSYVNTGATVVTTSWASGRKNESISARVSGTFADITVGLLLADSDVYGAGYGIDVSYTMGNLTIGANYSGVDDTHGILGDPTAPGGLAGSDDSYEIGFKWGLGGGATLAGAVGQNTTGNTVADFGMNFKF